MEKKKRGPLRIGSFASDATTLEFLPVQTKAGDLLLVRTDLCDSLRTTMSEARAKAKEFAEKDGLPLLEFDTYQKTPQNCISVEWWHLRPYYLGDIIAKLRLGKLWGKLWKTESDIQGPMIFTSWVHIGGQAALEELFTDHDDKIMGLEITLHYADTLSVPGPVRAEMRESPYDR